MSTLRVDNIKSRTGTTVTIPSSHTLAVTGNQTVTGSLTVSGGGTLTTTGAVSTGALTADSITVTNDLIVNGTTTTINSETLTVDDKNIELGSVATPTNATANGGGITLKSASDRTILWDSTSLNWEATPGITVKHVAEHMRTYGVSTSTVSYDYSSNKAQVFFMQAQSGNWTFAISNLPNTENRSYTFVFVTNGTSPGYPNAMTVGGTGVTIRWSGGSAPTPSSGGAEDVFTITLMRRGTDNGNTSAGWFAFGFASLGHA